MLSNRSKLINKLSHSFRCHGKQQVAVFFKAFNIEYADFYLNWGESDEYKDSKETCVCKVAVSFPDVVRYADHHVFLIKDNPKNLLKLFKKFIELEVFS
jgi:hypothetical protein